MCPQTLETLEMRLFAKRALLTATKRGGYRRNLLSGPSLLGSSYEGFCQRTYLSGYATNDSVCLSVMRVLGGFLVVVFFC